MKKADKTLRKMITAAAAAALLASNCAYAAPLDELNEILAQQAEQEESLLSGTLGMEHLEEAVSENGIKVDVKTGPIAGMAAALDMEGEYPEDIYGAMNLEVDTNLKRWQFGIGAGTAEGSLLDVSLYGERDLLALSIPQLYVGAVSVRSGSFKEQFEGSSLYQMLELTGEVPDFQLKYYPDEGDTAAAEEILNSFTEQLEGQTKQLEEQMRVEKTEADGEVIYTAYIGMDQFMDIYMSYFDMYFGIFEEAGLISSYEIEEATAELDTLLAQSAAMFGEELAVNFHVQDGLLAKMDYEMYVDPSVMEELYEEAYAEDELYTEAYGETELDSDFYYEAELDTIEEPFYIYYEIAYANPADPAEQWNIEMRAVDEADTELMGMLVTVASEDLNESTAEKTTVSMELREEGEILYTGTPAEMTYDSVTGDLDAVLTIELEETGERISFVFDSTILPLESGSGFNWDIDKISIEADGEAIGLWADLQVGTPAGDLAAPEEQRYLLELTEGALQGIIMELYVNLENVMAEFEAKMQEGIEIIEDETYMVEDIDLTGELTEEIVVEDAEEVPAEEEIIAEEVPDEAASVAIIGGADGPTSIFLAGKVG